MRFAAETAQSVKLGSGLLPCVLSNGRLLGQRGEGSGRGVKTGRGVLSTCLRNLCMGCSVTGAKDETRLPDRTISYARVTTCKLTQK